MTPRLVRLLVIVTVIGGILTAPAQARATFPGANGKIAFAHRGGVWVMNADGSGPVRLTSPRRLSFEPAWSADGTRIAYANEPPGGDSDIWVMNADGSGKTRITTRSSYDQQPDWSPDGRWLVFLSDRTGKNALFKIRSTYPYGRPVQLTRPELDPVVESDGRPDWSPLGNLIIFQRKTVSDPTDPTTELHSIYQIAPDGSGLTKIGPWGALGYPSWSPGARKIAAAQVQYYVGQPVNIVTMNPDGTGLKQVTQYPLPSSDVEYVESPVWSPYLGKYLLFDAYQASGAFGIFRTGSGGTSTPVRIMNDAAEPDWQPVPPT
jgi:Tol biopolymer transport system component